MLIPRLLILANLLLITGNLYAQGQFPSNDGKFEKETEELELTRFPENQDSAQVNYTRKKVESAEIDLKEDNGISRTSEVL